MVWQYLLSPRLYKIYREDPSEASYQPLLLEKWADKVVRSASLVMKIGMYTSPFICMYLYKRTNSMDEIRSYGNFLGGIGCLLLMSLAIRSYGRASNPKYKMFMTDLHSPMIEANHKAYLDLIRKYDFDFTSWPVTFSVSPDKQKASSWKFPPKSKRSPSAGRPSYQRIPIQVLAFIATHTFGLNIIFPGQLRLLQIILWAQLMQGRTQLVEEYNGQRTKIKTADGNHIDTMFVDQRNRAIKGKTLVICSEGNGGYYEIGIMTTPIEEGYSTLGWNHPGFAGSTGTPFPEQEEKAMDAVMQYAINELGFKPEDIVLFGWSIGGYTSAWAANKYRAKGLILDATFDDLLPLAENHMPRSWSLLVKEVVRSYVDLNIAALVCAYRGPVQLVRRTEDEIICLRQGMIESNRGNHLLAKLIAARHPNVFNSSGDLDIDKYIALQDSQRAALERIDISPEDRNKLRLIRKYMQDYKSTHCTPLPVTIFGKIMTNLAIEGLKDK